MNNNDIMNIMSMFHIGNDSPSLHVSSVNPIGIAKTVAPTIACKIFLRPNLVFAGSINLLKVGASCCF